MVVVLKQLRELDSLTAPLSLMLMILANYFYSIRQRRSFLLKNFVHFALVGHTLQRVARLIKIAIGVMEGMLEVLVHYKL